MKSVIKCHFYYLMNKRTLIITLITFVIGALCFVSNISHNKFFTNYEEINQYYQTSMIMTKLIVCFLSIFIFANAMVSYNDFYVYFIIPNKVTRNKYIFTKILLIIIIIFFITFVLLLIFLLVGFMVNDFFFLQVKFIVSFFNIFLIASVYGLYTMILMQLFQNIYLIIISFLIVILSNNIEELTLFSKMFLFVFPNIIFDATTYFTSIHLVWLVFMLCCINVLIYNNRDLNY